MKCLLTSSSTQMLRCWLIDQKLINKDGTKALDWCYVTCGEWDLRTCLPNECSRKEDVVQPSHMREFINVKKVFAQRYRNTTELQRKSRRQLGMAGMLQHLGLELKGRHHSGVDDSRNITSIVRRMIEDGHVFDKATSYVK